MSNRQLTIIGLIVTLVFALTGLYFNLFPRSADEKLLTVIPISRSPIITEDIGANLVFTVNGIRANKVYSSTINVSNSGTQPIIDSDFYKSQPVLVNLPDACEIVSMSATKFLPVEIAKRIHLTKNGHQVFVNPTLLNSGDTFNIDIVTANCLPSYEIKGTIIGVRSINSSYLTNPVPARSKILKTTLLTILIVFVIMVVLTGINGLFVAQKFRDLFGYGIVFFAATLFFVLIAFENPSETFIQQIPPICRQFIGGD